MKGSLMRALASRRLTDRVRLNTRSARTSTATPSLPVMRTRRPATATANGLYQPRANYYFDAGQQTAKTFRVLLSKQNATAEPLGQQAAPRLLAEAMESLLYSIRPGLDDDGESRAYFLSLLEMHLNRLHATEIDQLIASLNSLQFAYYITESVVDDVMKLEYGFTNAIDDPIAVPDNTRRRSAGTGRRAYDARAMAQRRRRPAGIWRGDAGPI